MDTTDVFSPASRTHQSSFGLLDDKAMQDLSLENLQKVRDKPPIPLKQKNSTKILKNENEFTFNQNGDNPEQTVESIHLNESDLKELEDEFTFDDDDESEESNEQKKTNDTLYLNENDKQSQKNLNSSDKSKNFYHSYRNELTNVSPDQFCDNEKSINFTNVDFKLPDRQTTQINNDLLMDESSNILRNSSDFDNTNFGKLSNSNVINYDKMDEINQDMDKSELSTSIQDAQQKQNAIKSNSYNQSLNFTEDQNDLDLTPKLKPNLRPYNLTNNTIRSDLKEKSSFNFTNMDETEVNDKLNITNENDNKNTIEKSSFNLTTNSYGANPNDFNTTFNNSNNFSSLERINQLVMQSVERVKRMGQAHMTCNSGDEYLSLINQNLDNNLIKGLNNDQKLANRFSTSTVRTTNFKNDDFSMAKENNELNNFTQANLTNLDNSIFAVSSKPFDQSITKENDKSKIKTSSNELPSMYFKPDKLSITNEDPRTSFQGLDSNSFSYDKNKQEPNILTDNPFDAENLFSNPLLSNQLEFSQFRQAGDFMEELKKDEALNRKEFADNELTVCMNYDKTNSSLNQTSGNNNSNDSNETSNEKWWNNLGAQASKLEVSNLSNSTLNDTKPIKPNENEIKHAKHKVAVDDYFNRKSEMPTYLAEKECDVRLSDYVSNKPVKESVESNDKNTNNQNDVTLCAEESNNPKESNPNSEEDITFSSNNQGSTLSSSNFSFTLNTSDTGDFIQKKTKKGSTTPFQLSKALASHMNKKQIESKTEPDANNVKTTSTSASISTSKSSVPSSLKAINEELDRVSNRLANTAESNKNTQKQAISEPLMSSSIKLNNTNPNIKLLMPMDDTISSINSNDLSSNQTKSKAVKASIDTDSKPSKESKSKETSSNNQPKSKITSGSLTSTPSKLTKSISESSNLNSISTSNIIDKFYKNKQEIDNSNNHLFNQESFISSIPERTNDSTLVGNHHHHGHHHNQQKHKSQTQSTKLKRQKNAEIQTSPDQTNSSSLSTNSNTTIDHKKLIKSNSQDDNNRASISSVSSTSSSSSDSTNPSSLTSQPYIINNLAAAMINSSTNNNQAGPNSLVPVAFIPLNSFFPCVQKFYDDMQTTSNNKSASNKSNFETNLSTNSLNQPINAKLFVDTGGYSVNTSSSLPSLNSQNGTLNSSKFELPQIELDRNPIDFGHIAEGGSQTIRIFAKLINPHSIIKYLGQNSASYIQFELCDSLDWAIDAYENDYDEKSKKLDDEVNNDYRKSSGKLHLIKKKFNEFNLKSKFRKTLSLHADKSSIDTPSDIKLSSESKLQYDLMSNFFEFFIHLNTKDLNFFKDLIAQLDEVSLDQLHPLLIHTNLYIYYYLNNNSNQVSDTGNSILSQAPKKYLLNRINLKFVLGYARLRTNACIDTIEFEILEDLNATSISSSSKFANNINEDIDRTLTSINDLNLSKKSVNFEQLIPLSNAGNIDIEVDCYLSYEQQEHFQSIKFKSYEIKLDDSVLCLPAKSKQFAKILVNKINNNSQVNLDLDRLKFTVEVKPNGFKYEIPVKIKFINKQINKIENQNKQASNINENNKIQNQLGKSIKLSSSRSILFFGKTLNSINKTNQDSDCGFVDEFTIANSNVFKITLSCTIDQGNYFKFSNEIKNSNVSINDNITQLTIFLEPQEIFRLKVKFNPPQNHYETNSILTGTLKMAVAGFSQKFNVNLVGFLSDSVLDIENGTKINESPLSDNLIQQLQYRNIKHSKYSIELIQTQTATLSSNKNVFRKVLKLKNKSPNSKCIIYPCLFNNKSNKEMTITTNRLSKSNELSYDLGIDSNGNLNRLRILLNKENAFYSTVDLNWIEVRADDQYFLNLEIISSKAENKSKSDVVNIEDIYICLFWIESEINSYCTQSTNFSNTKLGINFIDSFLNKFLSNTLFSNQNGLPMLPFNINESSSKLNRLSSVSSISLADQSSLSNNSMNIHNKSKISREDYLRLLRRSLKCTLVNLTTQSFEFDNESFEMNDAKKEIPIDAKNSKNSDLLQISISKDDSLNLKSDENSKKMTDNDLNNDQIKTAESWSVNPNTILIENIKNDKSIESYVAKIHLRNNLARKHLTFDLKYRSAYLSITPSNGVIEPLSTIEVILKPRKEVLSILPWFGIISIWCNKIQKDVRVSLYSNSSASNSISSNITVEVPRTLNINQSSSNKSNISTNSKGNFSNSSLNSLAAASSSTPYSSNGSNNSNSLEQGTIISEITQYTLDSLSLTPLISASFIMQPSSTFSTSVNQPSSKNSISKTSSMSSFKSESNQNSINSSSDDSITKIVRAGNDAQIRFPPVCVTQRKSVELTLTNPTNTYVNWKAFSTVPAFVRLKDDDNNIMKSSYSVFLITPNSGTIPANQTQKIKIEFCPRKVYGVFNQYWEIDTRTDFQDILNNSSESNIPTSYTCRLILTGKSIPLENQKSIEQKLKPEDDYNSRLANRILKSKTNTFNEESINGTENSNKPFRSFDILKTNSKTKENMNSSDKSLSYLNSQQSNSSSSLMTASLLSSTNTSTSSINRNKLVIKDDIVKFADTKVNEVSKGFLTIHNREPTECKLTIFTLMEPFYCKHTDLALCSKHYFKIPIEFKPKAVGEYTEKILIRVDKYDVPLTCLIKAKCIP